MSARPLRVPLIAALFVTAHSCATGPEPAPAAEPVPPQVIALKHVDCDAAVSALRPLQAESEAGEKLVVVAHRSSNALLLSGPPGLMTRAKDLVAGLDRPQ